MDINAFPVDTHIHRLAQRWGLTNGKDVVQTEKDLKRLFTQKILELTSPSNYLLWKQLDVKQGNVMEYLCKPFVLVVILTDPKPLKTKNII